MHARTLAAAQHITNNMNHLKEFTCTRLFSECPL